MIANEHNSIVELIRALFGLSFVYIKYTLNGQATS